MYLFFDTETTGVPKNYKAPVTDLDNWPRMIQIGWMQFNPFGLLVEEGNYIIKPEGYVIPEASAAIHGITTEIAIKKGHDLKPILETFNALIERSTKIIAHNLNFDKMIVGAEFLRKGIESDFNKKKHLCTMLSAIDLCQLPGKYGYKWPKLSELHIKLFGEDFEGAHDAFADISATAKCFWEMRRLKII